MLPQLPIIDILGKRSLSRKTIEAGPYVHGNAGEIASILLQRRDTGAVANLLPRILSKSIENGERPLVAESGP